MHAQDDALGHVLRYRDEPLTETVSANRIVELLRSGPRPVNDIGERLQLNQPQVSKHLRVLKQTGLVDVQPKAQQRLYALRAAPLRQLHDWLERYRQLWDARFEDLDRLVDELRQKEKEKSDGRKRRK